MALARTWWPSWSDSAITERDARPHGHLPSLRFRGSEPGDNLWAKLLEVASIPSNDLVGTGLDGATSNQTIVNRPAGNPIGDRLPNGIEIRLAIETDQEESAGDGLNAL